MKIAKVFATGLKTTVISAVTGICIVQWIMCDVTVTMGATTAHGV